jgi:glycerophosphoryl diester phosphodiesterase
MGFCARAFKRVRAEQGAVMFDCAAFEKGLVMRFKGLVGGALVIVALWLGNTSMFMTSDATPLLLAHRGVHQGYDRNHITNETCTAARALLPIEPIMENTIKSMKAAFDAGADIVELDLHQTADGAWAVFHDWTLECRTNGTGETRAQPMAALKALDIGYGYTADGGKTYPLRGTGIGQFPSLDEVITAFPEKQFFINFKSDNPRDGADFATLMQAREDLRAVVWDVYGGPKPVAKVTAAFPELRGTSRATLKSCLGRYVALGWSGYVPPACRDTLLVLPSNIAPLL